MILDNIPACWIGRRPNEYTLHSWFDVPTFSSVDELGKWALENKVEWILYFREEWTQAPTKAKFLQDGGTHRGTKIQIQEKRREDQYGWIWFRVEQISSPESGRSGSFQSGE